MHAVCIIYAYIYYECNVSIGLQDYTRVHCKRVQWYTHVCSPYVHAYYTVHHVYVLARVVLLVRSYCMHAAERSRSMPDSWVVPSNLPPTVTILRE